MKTIAASLLPILTPWGMGTGPKTPPPGLAPRIASGLWRPPPLFDIVALGLQE
jgi:hypothetical protein